MRGSSFEEGPTWEMLKVKQGGKVPAWHRCQRRCPVRSPRTVPGEVTPGCGTRGACAVWVPFRGDRQGLPGAPCPTEGTSDVAAGHRAPDISARDPAHGEALGGHKNRNTSAGAGDPRTPRRRPQTLSSGPVRSGGRREGLPGGPGVTPTVPAGSFATGAHPLPGSRSVRRAGSDLALLFLGDTATFCRRGGR